jgi:hypothetical protein
VRSVKAGNKGLVSTRRLRVIIVLLTVFQAVAAAWGIGHAHSGAAVAHAEKIRHDVLAAPSANHGHTHEDGEPTEQVPGHFHGHNVFDHSHETLSIISGFAIRSPILFREWNANWGLSALARPPDPIERPPKYF